MKNKRLACQLKAQPAFIDPATGKKGSLAEEQGLIRAKKYTNDHKDTKVTLKIPRGYKIIGVRAFNQTQDDSTLHVADFLVWKPQPGWLDISPEGRRAKEKARLDL